MICHLFLLLPVSFIRTHKTQCCCKQVKEKNDELLYHFMDRQAGKENKIVKTDLFSLWLNYVFGLLFYMQHVFVIEP